MSTVFKTDTLERAWLKTLRVIASSGQLVYDTDPFLEIQNLQIEYKNAFETDITHYTNTFGTDFLNYIHNVYSPEGDQKSGRNYYKLIHKQGSVDQVVEVVKRLRLDPLTRSATIVLASADASKQPCVTEVNFSVRNDLLQMTVIFKSSDIAKKFIPDMIELSRIHKHISQTLEIARGGVVAHILSAQLYEKDKKTVSKTVESITLSGYFKTSDVIENWDKEASEWDLNVKKDEHYVNLENGYSRFIDFMKKEVPNFDRSTDPIALDSGCGTGIVADILGEKGYRVLGIDISPEMLRFAHKGSPSTQYVLANSLDLPYIDDRFDVICTRGVLLSHVGKKYVNLFIQEHKRVLKKGGLFIFDFITHLEKSESRYRRNKASMSYQHVVKLLNNHGFEVVGRSGDDTNRVNAVACRKIHK